MADTPTSLDTPSPLKVRLLLERHQREVRAEKEAVEESHKQVQEAVRDAAVLRAKLKAIEGWRENEIHALRAAGGDAVNSIKVRTQGIVGPIHVPMQAIPGGISFLFDISPCQ